MTVELLVAQHDGRVLEHRGLLLGVVDEVGRQVAAVELQALDDFELADEARAVLDRDRAFATDLVYRARDQVADRTVVVGRNRGDVGDLLRGRRRLGDPLQFGDDGLDRRVDPALQVHRVHSRSEVLEALLDHRMGEHGRRRRAVAGHLARARRHFAQQLRAHVLEPVLELDRAGDDDARVDDLRRPELVVENHRAAARTERHLDGVGEDTDAAPDLVARFFAKEELLDRHDRAFAIAYLPKVVLARGAELIQRKTAP